MHNTKNIVNTCPKLEHGFPLAYTIVFFMLNHLMWEVIALEVIACFVDIGVIVEI